MKNRGTLFLAVALSIMFGSDTLAAIDPTAVLEYATYLGPRKDYVPYLKYVGIGVDKMGCAYVSTSLALDGFPITPDAMQKARSETAITKLNPDGGELIYSSFFGPPDTWTRAYDMAVDDEGNAYLVGITDSDDFPATPGSYHSRPIGPYPRPYPHDGFLIKLDPTLKNVIYGTYIGDNSWDEVIAVALDAEGCAYVTGDVGRYWACKFNPDGSNALYKHEIVGGYPYDIAVDVNGCAYVTGNSKTKFQTTPNAYIRNLGPTTDFVRKLDPSGHTVYSTFIRERHASVDEDTAIAVDAYGCAIICRTAKHTKEHTTEGAFDTTHNGGLDVYILKLDPTGSRAIWATYLGGNRDEKLKDVTVDATGNVYVTGGTSSTDFPTTETALDKGNNGDCDMFLSVLDAAGEKLLYSTVIGGRDYDIGQSLALDQYNDLYVAGTTRSTDFPTTEGAFKRSYSGLGRGSWGGDVFVVKLDMGAVFRTVTNLNTGAEYADLQTAIDEALPSDILEVGPGRYHEAILIDKSLTIQGMDPNDPISVGRTVIQGNLSEPALTLSGNSVACEIAGLTLQTGSVGVMGTATDATFRNCSITDNLTHGMELFQVSSPHLLHCLITANGKAGIKMHAMTRGQQLLFCEPVIEDCIIGDNNEAGIVGGQPVIVNSVIQGQ